GLGGLAPHGLAVDGSFACMRKNLTRQCPSSLSSASCRTPWAARTCYRGRGTNGAMTTSAWPGASRPTAAMIFGNGSTPRRRSSRTSSTSGSIRHAPPTVSAKQRPQQVAGGQRGPQPQESEERAGGPGRHQRQGRADDAGMVHGEGGPSQRLMDHVPKRRDAGLTSPPPVAVVPHDEG